MTDDTRQRQLQALWTHVTGHIKKTIATPDPTLFIAMEAARPLALDGAELILAISGPQYYLATNLEKHDTRTMLEQALSSAARSEIHIRIIQGESLADWEETKDRDRIARELSAKQAARPAPVDRAGTEAFEPGGSWDELLTQVHRAFTVLRVKNIPQIRAQYVLDMLPIVARAEQKLIPSSEGFLENRGLAHVLEKIAQFAETDVVAVALWYIRIRSEVRSGGAE
ncbi:MAG TPA: hypothetical protein VFJ58_14195 [Armatimonadota bacterium]|nr:hypothetical protein [Armatimonadota bacterium]